jgi:citrate lyase subunit beta/citryl-CoA lyase
MTLPSAASAGRAVRADLHVTIERTDSGTVEVTARSKVGTLYGQSIRDTARDMLRAAGIWSARVTIDDYGALPFTIEARIETALRRGGSVGSDLRPKRTATLPPPTPRDRLRRSRLYLPGNEPKYMVNAGLHKPDAIILDLEDSVHHLEKDAARLLVRNALRVIDFAAAERMVRINPFPIGHADLEVIAPESPDLILLPKAESADQVRDVAAVLHKLNPQRAIHIMPIIESALGIERAFDIAHAHPAVVALTIGLEDYTADLGVAKTLDGAESLYARARLVNAAKSAGIQAIDSVFGDVQDMAALKAWAQRSRALGFEGMGCIHPSQIPVIHEVFAPTHAEIEKARAIVAAFEDAQEKGLSVVSVGSRMVDPPVVKRALRTVEEARKQGLL